MATSTMSRIAQDSLSQPTLYLAWLLLDSRVVDVPMTYNSTFVMLSSLKSLFFSSRKMSHDSRTLVEHKTPESNKSEVKKSYMRRRRGDPRIGAGERGKRAGIAS